MRKCLVYGLRLPGGPIRYIGQTTKTAEARLVNHRYAALKLQHQLPVHKWLRKYDDVEAVVLVADARWNKDEQDQIARHADLLNCTAGGQGTTGWVPSEEYRAKMRRISTEDVDEIRELSSLGESYRSIAARYGISAMTVCHVVTRKRRFT